MLVSFAMPVLIGTSGWQYPHWRGRFYPERLSASRWLEHYAARFQSVEVNNTFYRLLDASTFDDWAARTPDDFVMAVKMSRFLTHFRRLRDPAEPVARFLEGARRLGGKLGPVLVQLPPQMKADAGRLAAALDCFPEHVRVAVEPRHASWFTDEVAELLASRDAALCIADSPWLRTPFRLTATWAYLRFHAGRAAPSPCYGAAALRAAAERLASARGPEADAYVFFNNDALGCAVRDAILFARAVERSGMRATRVPRPREVQVG